MVLLVLLPIAADRFDTVLRKARLGGSTRKFLQSENKRCTAADIFLAHVTNKKKVLFVRDE